MPKINSNKKAATAFLRLVIEGKIRDAYANYISPEMIHHNAAFAGDAASLEKAMLENHLKFPNKRIVVKHAVAEGDLVAVQSHIRMNVKDPGFAAVHIFRLKDERIVEMWDIAQSIPEESPNQNGMF